MNVILIVMVPLTPDAQPEFQLIRPMNFYVRAKRRTTWPEPSKDAKKIAVEYGPDEKKPHVPK